MSPAVYILKIHFFRICFNGRVESRVVGVIIEYSIKVDHKNMHDLKYLAEHKEKIEKRLAARGDEVSLDTVLSIAEERRNTQAEHDKLRSRQKDLGKLIGKKKAAGEDAYDLIAEMGDLPTRIKSLDARMRKLAEDLREEMLTFPNVPHESVPLGEGEEDNIELRRWGEPREFDFEPLDHADLGIKLGILDFERGAKIAKSRFTLEWGMAARMERALVSFMLDLHTEEHGYTEVAPPYMANRASNIGTGNLPKFEEELFKLRDMDLYLIPTAEVPVTNIHRDEIIEPGALPLYYTAFTPCFRSEAGAAGKDTKGLIRQHQFNKVELVKFVEPENSFDEHEKLTLNAEEVLKRLELPYLVVVLCTADMGFSSAKTYDIEVWLPGQMRYCEISSCSNFEAFQARRANIRYRPDAKSKPKYVHTLNGS